MTPAYAAPEQFHAGAITTATDVYSLGVLLGELLTGHRRCQGDARTPSAQVDATTAPGVLPAPPARIRRQLRGDLDNIVLKATAEEPERRYASAGAFAEDIERHLGAQPVSAHPPSAWYRTRKFVARHRGGVMTTSAFTLAVFAALGIALWQAERARHAAQRANAMRDFMVAAFAEAQPSVPRDGTPRVTEVVEQAIANARADTAMNAGVRIELVSQLGEVLRGQGRLAQAKDVLQWNLEGARGAFGDASPLALEAAHQLGATLVLAGEFDAARALLDGALARVRTRDALAANLHFDSALLASKQHALQRAMADADAGMRIARETGDADVLARALAERGNVQLEIDDITGATASFEELLALRELRFGARHVSVAATHADLSRAYRRAGKTADAERHIRAALAIDAAVLPVDDWRTANHLNALMMVLLVQRDYPAALAAARETLRINRVVHGGDHPETANDLNSVGMLHAQLEQWPAALVPLRDSLALSEARYGADHYETAVVRANYGVVLARAGDVAGGESEVLRALASLEADPEPDLDEQAATLEKLARLRLVRGAPDTVAALVTHIDALLARMRGRPGTYWEGRSTILHATALLQQGQPAQAMELLDTAAAALQRSAHPDPVLGVEVPLLQASAGRALGDTAAAERHAQVGMAALATLRHPPGRLTELANSLRPTLPSPAAAL
jgi:serine/threonine-protein kinase